MDEDGGVDHIALEKISILSVISDVQILKGLGTFCRTQNTMSTDFY